MFLSANTGPELKCGAGWKDRLVLPENQSAVRAVEAVLEALDAGQRPPFAPLVLHGGSGTGKTHLVTALLARITASPQPITARTIAAGGTSWTAADGGGIADPDLTACDLLVIEDVQHLPPRAADAAGDLIERLAGRGKAVIVTSGLSPAELIGLPRRLTSRLSAGLVVQMGPLGLESRRLIAAATARELDLHLSDEALHWLSARSSGGGVRSLLGLIRTLAGTIHGMPNPLSREQVEELLARAGQVVSPEPGIPEVVARVAAAFGVTEKELLGASRLPRVMLPRHVAMYLGRQVCGLSLPRLGAAFGGRDHTTVLHACRKIAARTAADERLAGMVRQLRAELGAGP